MLSCVCLVFFVVFICLFVFFGVLGMEPWALYMPSPHSTIGLYPSTFCLFVCLKCWAHEPHSQFFFASVIFQRGFRVFPQTWLPIAVLLHVVSHIAGITVTPIRLGLCVEIWSHYVLSGLALNQDPLDLCFLNSWDYRCEPSCPASKYLFLNINFK
jgi:hypothetical protein